MRPSPQAILAFAFVASVALRASTAMGQGSTSLVKPISIGISGGVSVPTGDLANGSGGFTGVNTGYNVTGSIAVGLPVLPLGLRGDVSYNGFGSKNGQFAQADGASGPYSANVKVIGATANVVYSLPLPAPIVTPYAIAGIGMYDVRTSPTVGSSTSKTDFGYNIGAGVKIPLVAFNAFVEARYHHVSQSNGSVSFVPITVGVMF
jgi:opacity protein-like surface antigen